MEIKEMLERLPLLKAKIEVILVELLEQKLISIQDIVICPRGVFARPNTNDVLGVIAKAPRERSKELLYFEVAREGIYDGLPQALVHRAKGRKGFKSATDMVADSKYQNEKEADARLFFLPFEQEFFRKRIELEARERSILFGFSSRKGNDFLKAIWGLDLQMTPLERSALFFLLPHAHQISGDIPLTAYCFSKVLQNRVSISRYYPEEVVFENGIFTTLGSARLGIDFISGSKTNDIFPAWSITVEDVALNQIHQYLESGQKRKLMEILISYFIPFEVDYKINICLKNKENGFVLNADPSASRLGYSSVFN